MGLRRVALGGPVTGLLNRYEQRELSQSLERRFDRFVPAPHGVTPVTAASPALSLSAAKWSRSSRRGDGHPRFFASERYIVYAKPVRVTRDDAGSTLGGG